MYAIDYIGESILEEAVLEPDRIGSLFTLC